jgi:hypothetical protein
MKTISTTTPGGRTGVPGSGALGVIIGVLALVLSACGSTSDGAGGSSGPERVAITSPTDGADVTVPFTLRWTSTVKLGPVDTGRDHVHVYVDGNSNDYTVVGANEFTVNDLSAGRHKVEISLQHADHSPVGPKSAITVNVVGGPGSTTTPSPSPTDTSTDDGGGLGY